MDHIIHQVFPHCPRALALLGAAYDQTVKVIIIILGQLLTEVESLVVSLVPVLPQPTFRAIQYATEPTHVLLLPRSTSTSCLLGLIESFADIST